MAITECAWPCLLDTRGTRATRGIPEQRCAGFVYVRPRADRTGSYSRTPSQELPQPDSDPKSRRISIQEVIPHAPNGLHGPLARHSRSRT